MELTPSLRQRVLAASERVMGAPERAHFIQLLRRADGYRLDPAATAAVAAALRDAPEGVEANLDLIRLSADGIWVEFPDAARRVPGVAPLPGTRFPFDVGVLATVDPDDDDRFVLMTAWDFAPSANPDGRRAASVRHAYAPVAFSREDISRHSFAARADALGGPGHAAVRMLGLAHAYLPSGLADELRIAADAEGDEEVHDAEEEAMRDAVSEAAFGLAALLFLSSRGARLGGEGDVRSAGLRRGALAPIARAVLGDNFRREGNPASPRLAFRPPAQIAAA